MMWDKTVKLLSVIGGAVTGLLGGWNVMLTLLAVMMGIDYVSGLIVAACGKSPKSDSGGVSSRAGFLGLAKKGFIILIVLMATVLDQAIGSGTMVFQMMATGYYMANEGVSILENAGLLGVPFPKKLRNALEELKGKNDEDADGETRTN